MKLMIENQITDQDIFEKYEFRSIRPEEADQAADIEQICFPPNEACSRQHMKERIAKAPELFLVAVDRSTGRLAGFLNGLATDEATFRDEFFTDANLCNPAGKNVMLLGLDVLPEYRRQGIAKALVYSYARRERENGRQMLVLTCLKSKVKMYEKMGFVDRGIANSTWGGEEWHEMSCRIER
jgi:ribosomal protein S18 acetylase RimI-like enzyme